MIRFVMALSLAMLTTSDRAQMRNQHDPDLPWWLIVVLNFPQSTKGTKQRLLRWPRRGIRARKLLKAHGATLVGLQEVGRRTDAAFTKTTEWMWARARPNTRRGRWVVGNGILADKTRMQRLHKRTLRVWRRWRGFLFIPVHLYRDRDTGDRVLFISGHADRKRPDPAANRKVLRAISKYGKWLYQKTKCPVVAVLDANEDKEADRIFQNDGWTHAAGRGIEKIYTLGCEHGQQTTLSGFQGEITDHGNPPAVPVAPKTRNTWLSEIPKRSR